MCLFCLLFSPRSDRDRQRVVVLGKPAKKSVQLRELAPLIDRLSSSVCPLAGTQGSSGGHEQNGRVPKIDALTADENAFVDPRRTAARWLVPPGFGATTT